MITFLCSRLTIYALGVRFDAGGLSWYFQFLDPEFLRTDLLRSVWYLHTQPPLFNLFMGIILKLFPGTESVAFAISYQLLGVILALTIWRLMERLGIGRRLNLALTFIFMISPQVILYENWLFYTYPTTTLLALSVLFLHRYHSTHRFRDAFMMFTLLASIGLTRSLFHLVWFVLILMTVLYVLPAQRRKTLGAATLPFLAILGWYVRTLVIFGSFSASTWMGMSLWRSGTPRYSNQERADLIAQGVVSRLAAVRTFRPLEEYDGFITPAATTGIPALDQRTKASGAPNFNNIAYLAVSKQRGKDALALVRHRPLRRCLTMIDAIMLYFMPTSDYSGFDSNSNRRRIVYLERCYDIALGQIMNLPGSSSRPERDKHGPDRVRRMFQQGLTLIIMLPLLFVYGCLRVFRDRRERSPPGGESATIAFICLNIAYVSAIGNAFEMGENMRFRFLIEPLFVVLLGVLMSDWLKRRAHRG